MLSIANFILFAEHKEDNASISHNSKSGFVGVSAKIHLVFDLIADYTCSIDIVSTKSNSKPWLDNTWVTMR